MLRLRAGAIKRERAESSSATGEILSAKGLYPESTPIMMARSTGASYGETAPGFPILVALSV